MLFFFPKENARNNISNTNNNYTNFKIPQRTHKYFRGQEPG